MHLECVALSTAMREVLPLRDLVRTVCDATGLGASCHTTFRTTVGEDNMGALTLANMDPGHNTPRSRFYDSKAHWFSQYLKPNHIDVKKIDAKSQIADALTKPCVKDTFERLRKMLCGW